MKNILKNRLKTLKQDNNDNGAVFIMVLMVSLVVFILVVSTVLWTMASLLSLEVENSRTAALDLADGARKTGLANAAMGKCEQHHNVRVPNLEAEYTFYYYFTDNETHDTQIPQSVRDEQGNLIDNLIRGCPTASDSLYAEQNDEKIIFYVEGNGYYGDEDDYYMRRSISGHEVTINTDREYSPIELQAIKYATI